MFGPRHSVEIKCETLRESGPEEGTAHPERQSPAPVSRMDSPPNPLELLSPASSKPELKEEPVDAGQLLTVELPSSPLHAQQVRAAS